MTSEKSTANSAAGDQEKNKETAASPPVEEHAPLETRAPDNNSAQSDTSSNSAAALKPVPRPMPQKTPLTTNSTTTAKPVTSSKPVAEKTLTRAPAPPEPSLPMSMIMRPHSAVTANCSELFPGELEESFESVLARSQSQRARDSLAARLFARVWRLVSPARAGTPKPLRIRREVAFDGFNSDLFEGKRERDRRYGTVYTVAERANAFVVRLELPRRIPKSSLKQAWELPDEMPDYACTLELADNVLTIRAGLPDEAMRRLSYVSSSFPSDFQTRIEFDTPVAGYRHRLMNKVLEVIVSKQPDVSGNTESRQR
jgi:hypothetical protein